jgi:small subunit ribosomal protein S17
MKKKVENTVDTSNKKFIIGKVVCNSQTKTLSVLVQRKVKHPILGKYLLRSTKYQVHDESNESNLGDLVEIKECRPISKTKSWMVVNRKN